MLETTRTALSSSVAAVALLGLVAVVPVDPFGSDDEHVCSPLSIVQCKGVMIV